MNLIEALGKKGKKEATHRHWFPHFTDLVTKVSETLDKLASLPHGLTALAGEHRHLRPSAEQVVYK